MSTSVEAKSSVETLTEMFRCFICTEKLQNARICPHCAKMCCHQCIVRWLTEQRPTCPHCRTPLYLRDLVNLRWAEDVSNHLDSLQIQVGRINVETEMMCHLHQDERLSIYCSECTECICHMCALFSGEHSGHSFQKLDAVYQEHMSGIQDQIVQINDHLKCITTALGQMNVNMTGLQKANAETLQKLENAWKMVCKRLEAEFKDRVRSLKEKKVSLEASKSGLETVIAKVQSEVNDYSKPDLIRHSSCFKRTLVQARRKELTCLASADAVSTEFTNEIVPSVHQYGQHGVFIIPGFSTVAVLGRPVFSDPIERNGICWRLKVYPNGSEVVRNDHLSVFLELKEGPIEPSKFEYTIEMVSFYDDTANVTKKFVSRFEVGECWGYNRFCELSLLPNGFLMDGKVRFEFTVRHASYYFLAKDQAWFIEKVAKDNEALKNRIQSSNPEEAENSPKMFCLDGTGDSVEDSSHSEVENVETPHRPSESRGKMETAADDLPIDFACNYVPPQSTSRTAEDGRSVEMADFSGRSANAVWDQSQWEDVSNDGEGSAADESHQSFHENAPGFPSRFLSLSQESESSTFSLDWVEGDYDDDDNDGDDDNDDNGDIDDEEEEDEEEEERFAEPEQDSLAVGEGNVKMNGPSADSQAPGLRSAILVALERSTEPRWATSVSSEGD